MKELISEIKNPNCVTVGPHFTLSGFWAKVHHVSEPCKIDLWHTSGHGHTVGEAIEEAVAIHLGKKQYSAHSRNSFKALI